MARCFVVILKHAEADAIAVCSILNFIQTVVAILLNSKQASMLLCYALRLPYASLPYIVR